MNHGSECNLVLTKSFGIKVKEDEEEVETGTKADQV